MIKLLRSSEIQVSELGNYEIPYFPYQNNNSEMSAPKFRCCYFSKENKGFRSSQVPRPVSPSSGGVYHKFLKNLIYVARPFICAHPEVLKVSEKSSATENIPPPPSGQPISNY